MALLADRVKETTTTTGTGTLNLDGAVTGYRTFVAGIGTGNTCYYACVAQSPGEWEVGVGTVTDATPDTLSRDTILASSNGGSAVNFSAGTKDVFVTFPAGAATPVATGVDASRPTTGITGRLYLPTDAEVVYRDSGTAWAPFGPVHSFTAPSDTGFSWINQGSATLTATNAALALAGPAGTGDNLRLRVKTAPAAPYTITAAIVGVAALSNGSYGLCFRQSSDGKLHCLLYGGSAVGPYSIKFTSPTAFSATYTNNAMTTFPMRMPPLFFRIADDNTNRVVSFSNDGIQFYAYHSIGRTDFLTADEVGFFVNARDANVAPSARILSWKEA